MSTQRFLKSQSDCFIGQRKRLDRYLVCSTQGYFPVLTKTGANSLAVIFRTGGTHVAPCATLAAATSADGGRSWTDPVEIAPRWDDCRNPAFGVNPKGELIAAYWKASMDCYIDTENGPKWNETQAKGTTATMFITCSSDHGLHWSAPLPYRSEFLALASPYGRITCAADGILLMGIYGSLRQPQEGIRDASILLRSQDGGISWGDETRVAYGYNETAYTFLPDGRLLAAARSESGHVAILSSADNGRTWSRPVQVTREGEHPADLTQLASGKVLMTFGRRIRPMGCGALISWDGGETWDKNHEILLAGDGIHNADLGYPSTVQLDDGHIVTVLYFASGSEPGAEWGGWGDISCQAIHYREDDIL